MEYITIGSIGFAQMCTPDYFAKEQIEVIVLQQIIDIELIPIRPKHFKKMCDFYIETSYHELGSYEEIILSYDNRFLDKFDDKFIMLVNLFENQTKTAFENAVNNNLINNKFYKAAIKIIDKINEFWNFVNKCEKIDLEDEKYIDICKSLYYKEKRKMYILHKKKEMNLNN
jgi:hypothetical protein